MSSGLATGDQVIVSGLQRAQPGAAGEGDAVDRRRRTRLAKPAAARRSAGLTRHVRVISSTTRCSRG